MTRVIAAAGLFVAVACNALAWPLPFGLATGNRLARGAGTFPRWQALALATEAPIRWLVTLPGRRLAAVDRDGALVIFEIAATGLRVAARYGGVASPDGPPVVVRLDHAQTGVVLVAPDGRLLVWSDDGALRGYDVGGPLSSATVPTPITFEDRESHDLLAVARDGAVVLIGGLAAGGPRAVARLDARALRDARITVADLDGDGASEAVVLSDMTDRRPPAALATVPMDAPGATSISVIRVRPLGLELRARFTAPPPAEFEDIVPVLAPVAGSARPVVLAAMIAPGQGAVPVALGLRDGGLVLLAEGPSSGPTGRWLQVVGAADLTGRRRARGRRGVGAGAGRRADAVSAESGRARRGGQRRRLCCGGRGARATRTRRSWPTSTAMAGSKWCCRASPARSWSGSRCAMSASSSAGPSISRVR